MTMDRDKPIIERRLTDLTIIHHGVPVGTAPLILRRYDEPDAEPWLSFGTATRLPAFDSIIGSAMARHKEAEKTWIRLPYPAAAQAEEVMQEAWDVVCTIWSELELQDEKGAVLPVPVIGFDGRTVAAYFEDAPAGVVARLCDRYSGGSDAQPPDDLIYPSGPAAG